MKYEDLNKGDFLSYTWNQSIEYQLSKKQVRSKYKYTKIAVFSMSAIILLVFNVLFIFDLINCNFTNNVLFTVKQMFSKPISPLFEDESDVFFVGWILGLVENSNINLEDTEFVVPITLNSSEEYEQGYLLSGNENVVYASSYGRVSKIAVENGCKLLEITHYNGIVTRYCNLQYVGVILGQLVDKKQAIGSIASNTPLQFEIDQNGETIVYDIDENGVITFGKA